MSYKVSFGSLPPKLHFTLRSFEGEWARVPEYSRGEVNKQSPHSRTNLVLIGIFVNALPPG